MKPPKTEAPKKNGTPKKPLLPLHLHKHGDTMACGAVIAEDPEQMSGDVCDVTCGKCYHTWLFRDACIAQGITSEAQRLARRQSATDIEPIHSEETL